MIKKHKLTEADKNRLWNKLERLAMLKGRAIRFNASACTMQSIEKQIQEAKDLLLGEKDRYSISLII